MIRTEGLTKVYESKNGRQEALQDVSIHVGKGDIFGIIGMSGAGKSTLLRLIGMLEQPTSGKVWIQGRDVSTFTQAQQKEQRKKLGIVFQGYNLLMQKTVRENVEFPLRLSKAQRRERAQELLKVVGLGDREGAYPSQLSGGQKQRVAIARALAPNPELLLLDEPTSALDSFTTASILELLQDLNKRMGITIVIITHEIGVVEQVCNKTAVLDLSRVAEQGDTSEIMANPKAEATRRLLGLGGGYHG